MNLVSLLEREWKLATSAKLFLILTALQPVLYLVIYAGPMTSLVGKVVFEDIAVSYTAFILPGTIVMAASQYALQASSALYMERLTGELEELLAAPISPLRLILARALASGGYTIAYMLIGITFYLIFIGSLSIGWGAAAVCLLACILTAVSLTMLFALLSIFAPNGRAFSVLTSVLGFPLLFFSSVFYPVSSFAPAFKAFAAVNPLSLGADLIRQSFFLPNIQQSVLIQQLPILIGVTFALTIVTGLLLPKAIK